MSSAPGVETLAPQDMTQETGNDLAESASSKGSPQFVARRMVGGDCPQDGMIPKLCSSSRGLMWRSISDRIRPSLGVVFAAMGHGASHRLRPIALREYARTLFRSSCVAPDSIARRSESP
jgi:hypothetical protein